MKKILLISHLFYPNNLVGAVRPTKLAEFLSKKGYSVDVVTQDTCDDDSLSADLSSIGKVFRLSETKISAEHKELHVKPVHTVEISAAVNKICGIKIPQSAKMFRRAMVLNKRAKVFRTNFKRLIDSGEINVFDYDVVVTSFGPLHSLLCGFLVKKFNRKIKWICDFRDPVLLDSTPAVLKSKYRKYEISACEKSDVVTAVSKGYKERVCGKKYENKSVVIPNGFDMNDIPKADVTEKNDKFTFTYVGALYDGRRDISKLFEALSELSKEGRINIDNVVFEYAGKGNGIDTLIHQAAKYSLENIVHNNGLLKRKDCLQLQLKSDVLVLATWNTKEEKGVFPGKMIEYMLFDKPIISLVNGDLENCEITETINKLNIGFSYEEMIGQAKFSEFKEYVCSLVNGTLEFAPDKEQIMEYEWNNIIKKFEAIING